MRSVGEPPASPGKTRARSLWSWLPVRVPAVNAGPFTTGMPMKVPDIRSGRSSANRSWMASAPSYSSPWMTPVASSVLPGSAPRQTSAGNASGWPSGR